MALNQVQVDHINAAVRPHMEQIILALHVLDTFVADHDAIQAGSDALPEDATVLDDAGDAPRDDAPQLTGAQVKTLRDLSAAMSAEISPAVKQTLISRMVRPLNAVLRVS